MLRKEIQLDKLKLKLNVLIDEATLEKNKAEQANDIMLRMEWQGRIIGLCDALEVIDRLKSE